MSARFLICCFSARSRRMTRPQVWIGLKPRVVYLLTGSQRRLYRFDRRWGMCVCEIAALCEIPVRHYEPNWSRSVSWMKRRTVSSCGPDAVHAAPVESTILGQCHSLIAHCATTRYEDGSSRKCGWMTIGTNGSAWTVTVKEPDVCASMRVTAPTLDEALLEMSVLLEADNAPWEQDPWLQARAPRKKK